MTTGDRPASRTHATARALLLAAYAGKIAFARRHGHAAERAASIAALQAELQAALCALGQKQASQRRAQANAFRQRRHLVKKNCRRPRPAQRSRRALKANL